MSSFIRLTSLALVALVGVVSADFHVWYGIVSGYGIDQTPTFYFLNDDNPSCDTWGGAQTYLDEVDDYTGADVGAQCTPLHDDESCFPIDRIPHKLQWNDDSDDLAKMTSCSLGQGASIWDNGHGGMDLKDSDGNIRGSCSWPDNPPPTMKCPDSYVYFYGSLVIECTTDCTAES